MRISPINNTNTNFKSKILPNQFFKSGLDLTRKSIERSETKSMNCAKDFLDSLNIIESSKRAKNVKFDMDIERLESYAYEDGKKVMTYPCIRTNYSQGYVAVQTVKQYAKSLNLEPLPTLLDKYKLNLEIAKRDYNKANEMYQNQLITILDDVENNL